MNPIDVVNHATVKALPVGARRAYFALLVRLPEFVEYTSAEVDRVIAFAAPGVGARVELEHAGLLVADEFGAWVPVTPQQAEGAEVFDDPAPQWRADAAEAVRLADEAGVLGDANLEEWRSALDYVARLRMEASR